LKRVGKLIEGDSLATWNDVRKIVAELPETEETLSHGNFAWKVQGTGFIWQRPLRKSDLEALGPDAPEGEILAARVESLLVKESALTEKNGFFFTTPHFNGYPAILVRLKDIPLHRLEDVIEQAWRCRAKKPLVAQFLAARGSVKPAAAKPRARTTKARRTR
jgi:hypothetical protein